MLGRLIEQRVGEVRPPHSRHVTERPIAQGGGVLFIEENIAGLEISVRHVAVVHGGQSARDGLDGLPGIEAGVILQQVLQAAWPAIGGVHRQRADDEWRRSVEIRGDHRHHAIRPASVRQPGGGFFKQTGIDGRIIKQFERQFAACAVLHAEHRAAAALTDQFMAFEVTGPDFFAGWGFHTAGVMTPNAGKTNHEKSWFNDLSSDPPCSESCGADCLGSIWAGIQA